MLSVHFKEISTLKRIRKNDKGEAGTLKVAILWRCRLGESWLYNVFSYR